MIVPLVQPTTMLDLVARLQAVLTACTLTGRPARLRLRATSGMTYDGVRHATVDMPFSGVEIGMLLDACRLYMEERQRGDDFAEVPPYVPPQGDRPF